MVIFRNGRLLTRAHLTSIVGEIDENMPQHARFGKGS